MKADTACTVNVNFRTAAMGMKYSDDGAHAMMVLGRWKERRLV